MGLSQSSIMSHQDGDPKYKDTLVRWHNKPPPEVLSLHLITSRFNYWCVAIQFGRPILDPEEDMWSFSGLMCIPQILSDRRVVLEVVDWPCARTLAAFPRETSIISPIGTVSVINTDEGVKNLADFQTCDILASSLTISVKSRFWHSCEQLHPTNAAPARTTFRNQDGGAFDVSWMAGEFVQHNYWDDKLNDKSVVRSLLETFGLSVPADIVQITQVTPSDNSEIDLFMATLLTKATFVPSSM